MKLPPDAKVQYRKLSMKSRLDFGKFEGMTVHDVYVGLNPTWLGRTYLIWCYYNLSNISFIDSVLDELGITADKRIAKPGVAPEIYEEIDHAERKEAWNRLHEGKSREEIDHFYYKKGKRQLKGRLKSCIRKELSSRVTAGAMAWKNQGHN